MPKKMKTGKTRKPMAASAPKPKPKPKKPGGTAKPEPSTETPPVQTPSPISGT
jgi:hypothetical protein